VERDDGRTSGTGSAGKQFSRHSFVSHKLLVHVASKGQCQDFVKVFAKYTYAIGTTNVHARKESQNWFSRKSILFIQKNKIMIITLTLRSVPLLSNN
jgi:hypothetical protein